ncbi:hypothetical protein F4679DRAFT_584894 [Xylaria curta]|nr:hypothetical protein F4679DRAFT_584894 [Xylaria curta]
MADADDVLACLYPAEGHGQAAALYEIDMLGNKSRWLPPQCNEHKIQPQAPGCPDSLQEREATVDPEEHGLEHKACLQLKFGDGANTPHGVVSARSPDADVRLV